MKKKILLSIFLIMIFAAMWLFATGCNNLKTNENYYLYTYEPVKGTFVRNNNKIVFEKDDYAVYDRDNKVVDIGEYVINDEILTFIPDKIGTASRIAASSFMYKSDEYIIDTAGIASRVSDTQFTDKDSLEGVYDNNLKLEDGIIYESADGSNIKESFTEKAGTYELNKKKDFVTFYGDDGSIACMLQFTYIDRFGYEVKALTSSFYTFKKMKHNELELSALEYEKTIFTNKSVDGGTANYNLALLSYPNKNKITDDVSYEIVGTNNNAAISGSTLSYTGTGQVQIEYKYGKYTDKEWIYIVDLKTKPNIKDSDRTYNVGNTVDYIDIFDDVTVYNAQSFAYQSIEISDEDKAEAESGSVTFNKTGTVEANLVLRYVLPNLEGNEVVEKTLTVNLIINP